MEELVFIYTVAFKPPQESDMLQLGALPSLVEAPSLNFSDLTFVLG